MRISNIAIHNFRSIEDAKISPNNFNVFVGRNNHGKTNFFEAINWFYYGKSNRDMIFNHDESREIIVEIEYENVQSGIDAMPEGTNKTKIKNLIGDANIVLVRKNSKDDKRVFVINDEEKKNPSGIDTALNHFFPKLEYIDTKIRLADVSKYKSKSPIAEMLSGVLTTIVQTNPDYQAFEKKFEELFNRSDSEVRVELDALGKKVQVYLEKQFPEGTTVKFNVENPIFDDLLKNFETEVDDGIKTSAEEKGDGMQRAIMLSIIQAYAEFRKEKSISKNFLFLIDEAELHLHPSGQRALKKALMDISKQGDQVFINTHSSVLVADDQDDQNIFKVEKNGMKTEIESVSDYDEKINVVYELLGGSPNDLLLPRNFLIVEGQSEFVFLESIRERFYKDQWKGIKFIFARGDIEMQKEIYHCIHRAFVPLMSAGIYKCTTVIICDKPNSTNDHKYDEFKQSHPWILDGEQLHVLPEDAIEKYYPDGFKKNDSEIENLGSIKNGKVDYAKSVAKQITQKQFEEEMPAIFQAMNKCLEKAYCE